MYMNQLDTIYKSYGSKIDLGSFGVTGVKTLFFTQKEIQNASSPTEYVDGHVTHAHELAWPPFTKVMVLKIHQGSTGVTKVKILLLHKTFYLLQFTVYIHTTRVSYVA